LSARSLVVVFCRRLNRLELISFSHNDTILATNLNCEYTPWAIKNGATFIFTINLANVDRFQ